MKINRKEQQLAHRTDIIESFGFYCECGDGIVSHPLFDDVKFDFSATNVFDQKSLLISALVQVEQHNWRAGQQYAANKLTELLKYFSDLSTIDE